MLTSLSSTVCSVPARPALLLQRCRRLGVDGSIGLTLDTRLPLPVQRELLRSAASVGVRVAELALPLAGIDGRPLGCPLSDDREERQVCGRAMLEAVQLAASHGVARVLFHPWSLSLHVTLPAMLRLFAQGGDLPQAALQAERDELADGALDRLRAVLDPVLELASALAVQLCFAGPAIWPQQLPSALEVERLRQDFAGAPLLGAYFSDWAHARAALFGEAEGEGAGGDAGLLDQLQLSPGGLLLLDLKPSVAAPDGDSQQQSETESFAFRPVRLADACGTRLRLPLGLGESNWRSALSGDPPEAVLAFDEQTTPAEVAQSRRLIAEALTARQSAAH